LGWSIGKTAYLVTGSHWHRSGLDSVGPWQGDWENNVRVECVGDDKEMVDEGKDGGELKVVRENVYNMMDAGKGSEKNVDVVKKYEDLVDDEDDGAESTEQQSGSIEKFMKVTKEKTTVMEEIGDCIWSKFGPWSECTKSCGKGSQIRLRSSDICSKRDAEKRFCNEENCTTHKENVSSTNETH
jgi:hypothetical protein